MKKRQRKKNMKKYGSWKRWYNLRKIILKNLGMPHDGLTMEIPKERVSGQQHQGHGPFYRHYHLPIDQIFFMGEI